MRTATIALMSLLLAPTLTACEGSPTGPTAEPEVDPGRTSGVEIHGSTATPRFSQLARSVVR
jgi:hypothetical protein